MEIKVDDRSIYLARMAAPLQEKMKVVRSFPPEPKYILDVGCADGTVTVEIAKMFPDAQVLGIDLDGGFIEKAKQEYQGMPNIEFRRVYLRDLLAESGNPRKYDVVSFISVLHEFYTYGEGISSVMKAIADAHELLRDTGTIAIRDMMVHEFAKSATLHCRSVLAKIKTKQELGSYIEDHERNFGKMDNVAAINHFLLKYWYQENWEKEGAENYLGVTVENYHDMFRLLGMKVQQEDHYLMDYLRGKWMQDFGLNEAEIALFKSTGIMIATR